MRNTYHKKTVKDARARYKNDLKLIIPNAALQET